MNAISLATGILLSGAGCARNVSYPGLAGVVRAGGHAVAAAEAALGHLADDAGGRVHVHCLLGADADARGFFAAMLAEDGDEGGAALRTFGAIIDPEDADPGKAGAIGG